MLMGLPYRPPWPEEGVGIRGPGLGGPKRGVVEAGQRERLGAPRRRTVRARITGENPQGAALRAARETKTEPIYLTSPTT
jgi:hypothetical protein